MPMNVAQQETVQQKVRSIVRTISDAFPNKGKSKLARSILWGLMNGSRDSLITHNQLLSDIYSKSDITTKNTIAKYMRLYSGDTDLFEDQNKKPTIGEIRAVLFRATLKTIHEALPEDLSYPLIPEVPSNIQGMERIRALFSSLRH